MANEKERVQLDLTPEVIALLDACKDNNEDATRAETIRKVLKVYRWLKCQTDQEGTIKIYGPDGKVTTSMPIKLL
jgi:hypothetical protein